MGGSIVRIDVSRGAKHVVTFVNNIERDGMYARWPRALNQLTYPTWSLHTVQRNLYTLLAVVDPASYEGAALLLQLQAMHQQQYPLRFGIVLACESRVSLATHLATLATLTPGTGVDWEAPADTLDLCRLFAHAKQQYGAPVATAFLFQHAEMLTSLAQQGSPPHTTRAAAADLYADSLALASREAAEQVATVQAWNAHKGRTEKDKRAVSKELQRAAALAEGEMGALGALGAEARAVLGYVGEGGGGGRGGQVQKAGQAAPPSPLMDEFIANSTAYLQARGLPTNSYSMNGIVRTDIDLSSSLMQLVGREQYLLGQHYRAKKITDKTPSIFAAVLADGAAYPRYHPLLDDRSVQYTDLLRPEGKGLMQALRASWLHSSAAGGEGEVGVAGDATPATPTTTPTTPTPTPSASAGDAVVANSTLVVVPVTPAGLASAAAAYDWLQHHAGAGHRLAVVVAPGPQAALLHALQTVLAATAVAPTDGEDSDSSGSGSSSSGSRGGGCARTLWALQRAATLMSDGATPEDALTALALSETVTNAGSGSGSGSGSGRCEMGVDRGAAEAVRGLLGGAGAKVETVYR